MSEPSTPSTWRVDSQVEENRVNATGIVEAGVRIAFTTGQGHTGTVFVPQAKYTPAQVKPLLAEAAANVDAIGSLSHDSQV